MQCIGLVNGGINKTCNQALAEAKAAILYKKGEGDGLNYADKAAIEAVISAGDAVYLPFADYENQTEGRNMVTADSTKKFFTNDPLPFYTAYLEVGHADYMAMLNNSENSLAEVVLVGKDGSVLGWTVDGVNVSAFTVRITAHTNVMPKGDIQKSFPLSIAFQKIAELKKAVLVRPASYNVEDLYESNPDVLIVANLTNGDDDATFNLVDSANALITSATGVTIEVKSLTTGVTVSAALTVATNLFTAAFTMSAAGEVVWRIKSTAAGISAWQKGYFV